jgi:hypothetical protein
MHRAELCPAMPHREEHRAAEGRHDVDEVSAAELPFARRSHPEDALVLDEHAPCEHVRDHRRAVRRRNLGERVAHPPVGIAARQPTLLQDERHHLLGVDVCGPRRRNNRIDEPRSPERGDAERNQEIIIAGGQKQAVLLVPALRPLRPMRCRKAVTEGGASICTTRSRSPTSMPSSIELVATMAQSGSDANAASACRRSSAAREPWDTKVRTPARRSPSVSS